MRCPGERQLAVLFLITCGMHGSRSQEVKTANGRIRGSQVTVLGKSVGVYVGIPFAQPPVGELRFKHPVPASPWGSETKDALEWKPSCLQPAIPVFFEPYRQNPLNFSEDCLYLNVWVPSGATSTSNLTTMVWIHGGAFSTGSTNYPLYHGQYLAAGNDVIVVSISYRLGPLGFAYLSEDTIPGNMGLMDQRLGMKWVYDNIENFGGNRNRITIFGESAGGASVGLHLLSPLSRDLFQYAILESGCPNAAWATGDPDEGKSNIKAMAALIGCFRFGDREIFDCLKTADAKLMSENQFLMIRPDPPFLPIVDGHFLPESPDTMLAGEDFKKTKILTGVMKDEATYFISVTLAGLSLAQNTTVTQTQFMTFLTLLLNNSGLNTEALALYYEKQQVPSQRPNYLEILNRLQSDLNYKCPAIEFASIYAGVSSVYLYSYNHRLSNSIWPDWTGATHSYELESVFGKSLDDSLGLTDQEKELSRTVMTYWTNFAKSGDPNSPVNVSTQWPVYDVTDMSYQVLDVDGNLATWKGLRYQQCVFINDILPKIPSDDTDQDSKPGDYCTAEGATLVATETILAGIMLTVFVTQ